MKKDGRDSAECQNWEKNDKMVIIEIVVSKNMPKIVQCCLPQIKITKKWEEQQGLDGEQQISHFFFRERATSL